MRRERDKRGGGGAAGEGEPRVSEGGWRGRVAGEGDWPKRVVRGGGKLAGEESSESGGGVGGESITF